MIGTAVERQGIIRHGAKMISAVSEATVPKISVVVRKAYGAGLYAMAGPAFEPDCCIALPSASIAVMGPQAAVNAVFYNQIQAIDDEAEREAFVAEARGVRRGHRPPPPRLRAGRRRGDRPDRAARRPDQALRDDRRQGSLLRHPAQPGHACLSHRYRFGLGTRRQSPARRLPRLRRRLRDSRRPARTSPARFSISMPSCSAISPNEAPARARSRPASSCSAISPPCCRC